MILFKRSVYFSMMAFLLAILSLVLALAITNIMVINRLSNGSTHLERNCVILNLLAVVSYLVLAFIAQHGAWRVLIEPLYGITDAMARLAAGARNTEIPGRDRQDEIGALATACEAFRLNVLTLDQAHESMRLAEEQAQLLARHDALTGLHNRRVFSANLQTALDQARLGQGAYALLLIDLDDFKKINDIQGHNAGDTVLCAVARRLKLAVRQEDTVARLGGDEFAIITHGATSLQEHMELTKRLATRLLGIVRQPIDLDGTNVEVGVSIGIYGFDNGADDVTGLLRAADVAMYRAKQNGRFTFCVFEQSMDDEMRAREALERDVAQALADGSIRPHYQLFVDISSRRIRGFEALARWTHPERGIVPPDQFIPVIEQLGLTSVLSSAILRQICRDTRQWPNDIRIAINISSSELRDKKTPTRIARVLREEGVAPSRLEVEITESALVSDLPAAKFILAALRAQGITISLDDFGTGYSSLYHLRELKFDKVKIDRSFVRTMLDNAESEKIIDAILGLTSSLQILTVAEGVEDITAVRMLATKGCAMGQGYYFGKAVPAAAAAALLTSEDAVPA